MAKDIDTHISWKTQERTPFGWHVVLNLASLGENGFVAGETTAFELLGRIVINTE